ncbi:DUF998 domain-containing protein [Pseudoalteromonas luteoviolacea]|uniref:DUF998 domain-containing protein n=1 Tax=Pseudoalteromonas luteoviolacea S4054 TaxID=1129367 RepID=A0A0F6A9M4_9GAMM|nr:DUF998 domain-containing protein [Pseudoalteromonas luteoviolacea]AOT10842.1 hypothetical protein S4054249_23640 [Pseudoalteromonas luteoviolacea]AOT15996.1 hypothetical protein S40542_24870 [Pseudoalteromonas luteoviolacea]AOT20663.1 hypothetical protein S4054_23560 [Pseudoalteromonas luteoviolacea]KKE82892.1 hypothetical protein N479_16600 [Pseudoalteromonas luteoviolacea S4054]KZN75227.1 hypothetical protein N481_07885 [Pseudoalteromonas luteoviolacea S4047-1]
MEGSVVLLTGFIATIWITLGVYIAGKYYPNYNHKTQFCSELGAAGSPTEKLSPLINNYPLGILFCAFGWSIIEYTNGDLTLVLVGWLIIVHGIGTWVAGFFPMDKDPYTRTPTRNCQIHSHAGFIMLLSLLIAPLLVLFSDLALSFRVFSGASVAVACFYLYRMAKAFKQQTNLGLYQRLSYWAKLIWLATLSLILWSAS